MNKSQKPNIVLIMCDQLRFDVLECYGPSLVDAPHMNRIAQGGVVFKRAYSQTPVCMPARYGLISGKSPFELGLVDNSRTIKPFSDPLPEVIREQGYYTCAVGKMHFTPTRKHYGFDRMYLSEEIPQHYDDDDYLQFLHKAGYGHVIEPHGKRSERYYVPQSSVLPEQVHTTAWTANETCRAIRRNRNRPFFIFASFIKPHPPFDPCAPYDTMYDPELVPNPICQEQDLRPDDYSIELQNDYKVKGMQHLTPEDIRKIRAHYYGCVSQLDKQIGVILDELDANGLTDNTLVILTSDHGEMLGDHCAFGKRSFYEQSARIPLIVKWPGVLPAGACRDELAILQDIYATAIAASGGEVPGGSSGKNLVSLFTCDQPEWRNKVFAEFGSGKALKLMLRWGNYKYIHHAHGGAENLYDLMLDPDERHNIAASNPDITGNCRLELVQYYSDRGFDEALDPDRRGLKVYPYRAYVPQGYLDQFPSWQTTKVEG